MNKIKIDGFKRITKTTAKAFFTVHWPVYIIERGYRINNPWQPQVLMSDKDPRIEAGQLEHDEIRKVFDVLYKEFCFYHKRGADFYLKQSDLEATPQEGN